MLNLDRPELAIAATPLLLARGAVHVIGLEPLRDQAGPRWNKIKDGVHARLEMLLRQRLGPSDFFAPLNDTAYLVTIPGAERDDAEVACLRLAHELYTSYLGQCDLGAMAVYRAAQGEGGAVRLDTIPRDRLNAAARSGGISTPAPRVDGLAAVSRTGERALAPFRSEFLPVWDARNEAVIGYVALARHVALAGGTQVSLHDLEARERMSVDLANLRQGTAALTQHVLAGNRFLMIFRIALETLAAPVARMELTGICRALSSDFRPYLVFEVVDIPEGVPQGRLADLVAALRPFAKGVRAEVPAHCHNYFSYDGLSLQAIGLDLAKAKTGLRETQGEILRLSAAARRLSLATFLDGVSDQLTLRTARETGIQFITGSAIGAPLAEPRRMTRLGWREIMEAAARKGPA